ncbi:MAG TPA: ATP-binding protein, partial [Lentisphaeria bacterium]|nr:ATP-binding protein [Lentisphaeria bacterium]
MCSVFMFTTDDGTRAKVLYEWAADNDGTARNSLQEINLTSMPDFRNQLERRRDLVLPNVARPPPAHADVARFYQEFGIKSALATGVWLEGKLWGFLCMHYLKAVHSFTKSDIHTIHDAVNLFMLAHERNRQMNAIADSSYLHRQIFDTLNLSVAMIDFEYNITMANAFCLRKIGKTQAELQGEKCYHLLCKCSAPPAECPLRHAAQDRQPRQVECVREGRHLLVMSQPIFDRSGRVMSVLEISIDTTELYQQKQQLEVNNLLLNRAAEVAQMTYFKGDRSGRITWLGGNEDMGISRLSSILLREVVVEEDAASIVRACLELTEGQRTVVELICRTELTGPRRSTRLRMSSREQADGAFFGIMQDITAQVEAETLKNDLIQRLNNYIENERVLNNCLAQSVLEDNFDKNIDAILGIIAAQLHCERVFCGMFADGMLSFALQYEWKRSGLAGWRGWGLPELEKHFRQWREEGGREIIKIVDTDSDDELRSLLSAPIRLRDSTLGVLQFEYAGGRDFTDVDESVIRSAARIISLIKEREIQRERLDASIRERQIIYNHIKIPILLFDRRGALLNMNPAAADLCANLHDDTDGVLFSDLFKHLLPSGGDEQLEEITQANRTLSRDIQFGSRHYIMNVEPIIARNDEVNNIIASLVDVTAIVESKRHLEMAMKAAQAADRAKSYFLAMMSHELRTPLNSVIGFSELLQMGSLTAAERDECLVSINTAGKALLNLISDILDLSKIEADQLTIKPIRTKVAGLLSDLCAIFKHKAKEKKLAFNVKCPDNLPDIFLDNLRLRQVMLNLIGNAIKFTPTGSVGVEVSFMGAGVTEGVDGDDGELTISVSDTGIGIDAAHLQRIFDPFVQEDDARGNRAYDGSGLGLAISKRLVDKMGGTLEVESQVSVGSCFRLVLRQLHYAPSPVPVI